MKKNKKKQLLIYLKSKYNKANSKGLTEKAAFLLLMFFAFLYLFLSISLIPYIISLFFYSLGDMFTIMGGTIFIFFALSVFFMFLKKGISYLPSNLWGFKTEKINNNYLIFALTLSLVFFSIGFTLYGQIYEINDLEIEFNSRNIFYDINCKGKNNIYTIDGGEVFCTILINNTNNDTFEMKNFTIYDFMTRNDGQKNNYTRRLSDPRITPFSTKHFRLDFPVGEPGIREFYFIFYYNDDNHDFESKTGTIKYNSLSLNEYSRLMNEKMTVILLIFSIGLFSIFSLVKNLKDIID